MSPPVIFGDTRSLTLAPHNASYLDLEKHLKIAGINVMSKTTKIEERISAFARPFLMRVPKQSVLLQPPTDFMKMALP